MDQKKVFQYASTANIDANLYHDILAHEDKVEKICIVILIVLIYVFRGWIGYWLNFGVAIPSGIDMTPINVSGNPIQTDYTNDEKVRKTFTYKSLINDHKMEIIPQAHYVLPGVAVAYNHDFLFISEFFDSAALYDLGTSWGKLADKETFKKYIKVYSQKVEMTGSRRLNWTWKPDTPFDGYYINSHISHSHLIPANKNIMSALLKIKVWDKVEIEGELVDMKYKKPGHPFPIEYHTSLSRTDIDSSSRGSGACETVYVTKVRIGNVVYK
ncbi:hypothetical protein IJ541_02240 [bacterium]|nr:hypothetical protein [bacterium]